jgi:hypothetical protein
VRFLLPHAAASRRDNAQLLRHLGVAFIQRGYFNESRTAFDASLHFEKSPAVNATLLEPVLANASVLPPPRWLRGQTVSLLSFFIPVILLFVFLGGLDATDQSSRGTRSGGTVATRGGAAPSADTAQGTGPPTPMPEATRPPCLNRESKLSGLPLYNDCKKTRAQIAVMLSEARTPADKDDYRVLGAIAEVTEATAAYQAHVGDYRALAKDAIATFKDMKDGAHDPKARSMARQYYDCYALSHCPK